MLVYYLLGRPKYITLKVRLLTIPPNIRLARTKSLAYFASASVAE